LSLPARDTLPLVINKGGKRVASLLRSRGCPYSCSFCDTPGFTRLAQGPAWRVRSAEGVADEIQQLVEEYGVNHVQFWDDNFMGTGSRGKEEAQKLAEELVSRGIKVTFSIACRVDGVDEVTIAILRRAGLQKVFLGVESGIERALETFHKRVTLEDSRRALKILEDQEIEVTVGFIMFDPYLTLEELTENVEFLLQLFGSWGRVRRVLANPLNMLEVYAGTEIKQQLQTDGLLLNAYQPCPPLYKYRFKDRRVAAVAKSIQGVNMVVNPFKKLLDRMKSSVSG